MVQELESRATTNQKQEDSEIKDQQQQTVTFSSAVVAETMTNPLMVAAATRGREDAGSVEEENYNVQKISLSLIDLFDFTE